MPPVKLPIGITHFRKLIEQQCLYIDKTPFIADFLDRAHEVTLITRPRRSGKTLNLSMLQHFLSPQVNGLPTRSLFDNLEIATLREGYYMAFQGQNPVIFLSLKDVRHHTAVGMMEQTLLLLKDVYQEFEPLLKNSPHLSASLWEQFEYFIKGTPRPVEAQFALKKLSECLYAHYQKPVYILIDEYDAPLNMAYQADCFEEIVPFFRDLLSITLKDNPFMARGVLTGILRVAKDSIFSGLNHLHVCTVMDNDYSAYFGFTEKEVTTALKQFQLESQYEQIRQWYDGYRIGNQHALYNPWSILSCLGNQGKCDVYWVNTANNDLLQKALLECHESIDEPLAKLIHGEALSKTTHLWVRFSELTHDEKSFWGLLLSTGYLTSTSSTLGEDIYQECVLRIPNQEITRLFNAYTKSWLKNKMGTKPYQQSLDDLVNGDIESWMRNLDSFLKETASHFDLQKNAQGESFYHGFCLGLVTQLYSSHHIRSNREAGYGRCDLWIMPKTPEHSVGWMIEFKHAKPSKTLEKAAEKALLQIQSQDYSSEWKDAPHLKKIIQLGVAFSGKKVAYRSHVLTL